MPSLSMVSIYRPVKARSLLKQNVDALLRKMGADRKDLAFACRRSESWISKIYREDRRSFQIEDLDKIADFFGLKAYELFRPGVAGSWERRSGLDRRSGRERRIGHSQRLLGSLAHAIDSTHPRRGLLHEPGALPASAAVKALVADFERRFLALLEKTDARGPTPRTRGKVPKTLPGTGTTGGSDPETP